VKQAAQRQQTSGPVDVKLNTLTTTPEAEQVNNGKGFNPQALPKSQA